MRRLLPLVLLLAPMAHGAYRTNSGSGANPFVTAATYPCTVGINPNIGDLFIVIGNGGYTGSDLTIAGGGVTTWHPLPTAAGKLNNAANNQVVYFWGVVTTANTTLATVTNPNGSFLGGAMCGLWTNSTLDQGGTGTFQDVIGPSTTSTTPSITTTHAVEDLIAVHRTTAGSVSTTAPFTSVATITFSGTPYATLDYQTVSSTNTYSAAASMASGETINGIASFYTVSGGSNAAYQVGGFLVGP